MPTSFLKRSLKPEYFYRPQQIVRRLLRPRRRPESAEAVLPWGLPIQFHPKETVGDSIWKMGVFELPVCEVIWRLLDPGDSAVDAGANIGHMTALMAARVGSSGSVWAFEPHPTTFAELAANGALWQQGGVRTLEMALSDTEGQATLLVPEEFTENRGTPWLAGPEETPGPERSFTVRTTTLDALTEIPLPIGMLKMDVQGAEGLVLRGAENLLRQKRIRDIVFEEEGAFPTEATLIAEKHGYSVFRIGRRFNGAFLRAATETPLPPENETKNFLATSDPERAKDRLLKSGWQALRGK